MNNDIFNDMSSKCLWAHQDIDDGREHNMFLFFQNTESKIQSYILCTTLLDHFAFSEIAANHGKLFNYVSLPFYYLIIERISYQEWIVLV